MKFIKRKLAYSESTPVQVDFHNTLESLDEVFRIISLSKLGKKTLSQFLPLLQSGEIWVEDLLREDAIRLQRENGVHGSVEAAFYYDGNQKRIYVNSRCKVGLLAPLFFHEMVHSLDEEYIRSYHDNQLLWQDFQEYAEKVMAEASMKSQKKVSEIRVEDCNQQDFLKLLDLKRAFEQFNHTRTYKTELKAYRAQYEFTLELFEQIPGYREFLEGFNRLGFQLLEPVSSEDIVRKYGLKNIAA